MFTGFVDYQSNGTTNNGQEQFEDDGEKMEVVAHD